MLILCLMCTPCTHAGPYIAASLKLVSRPVPPISYNDRFGDFGLNACLGADDIGCRSDEPESSLLVDLPRLLPSCSLDDHGSCLRPYQTPVLSIPC